MGNRLRGCVGVLAWVAIGCGQTVSGGAEDAAVAVDVRDVVTVDDPPSRIDVVDVVDVGTPLDIVDVRDVPVVMDVRDVPDVPAVEDRPTTEVAVCQGGLTACMVGDVLQCVDTRSDSRHCGGCGQTCCAGSFCFNGSCPLGCAAGTYRCTPPGQRCPICTDVRNDPRNCGQCNRVCASNEVCNLGQCQLAGCATVTEPAMPMGVCDGRGREACLQWARDLAGGNPNATAVCIRSPAGCARATTCDESQTNCRCGDEPACGANQVCVSNGTTAQCACARPVGG